MDLADPGRLCPASPLQGCGRGPEVALEATAASPKAEPDAGVKEFRNTLASGGHAGPSAETPRKVAWKPEGQLFWSGEALPGRKKGRLRHFRTEIYLLVQVSNGH